MTFAPERTPQAAISAPLQWITATAPVPYEAALAVMEARVGDIAQGLAPECVWLLGHPPLYTAGTSADPAELLGPDEVSDPSDGARRTLHLSRARPTRGLCHARSQSRADATSARYVTALEDWLIATVADFGLSATRNASAVGVYVDGAKIASIGVRVRRWVSCTA